MGFSLWNYNVPHISEIPGFACCIFSEISQKKDAACQVMEWNVFHWHLCCAETTGIYLQVVRCMFAPASGHLLHLLVSVCCSFWSTLVRKHLPRRDTWEHWPIPAESQSFIYLFLPLSRGSVSVDALYKTQLIFPSAVMFVGFPCNRDLVQAVLSIVSLTSVIIQRLKVGYFADVIISFTVDRFYEDGQFRVRI